MNARFPARKLLYFALLSASIVAIGLFGVGAVRNQSLDFWYLPYNLALAAIPLLLSFWLRALLKNQKWTAWLPIVVTGGWVLFLPNSFYVVSDFIHLNEYPRVDMVQDVVMLMQFSVIALLVGFLSLYIVHQELIKRLGSQKAHIIAIVLIFLCSFAIYLGRDLRWNSWDVVVQPAGLFGDVVGRLINPLAYPGMWSITFSFFVMLVSLYFVLWGLKGGVSKSEHEVPPEAGASRGSSS